jgi:anti-sigma B factor antagonist
VENRVPSRGDLEVQVGTVSAYAVVTVTGPVDFGTHAVLQERLDEAMALTQAAVIVDMAAVGFCDSSGLRVFARAVRQARPRAIALVVTGLQDQVAYVFTTTGIDQALFLEPDVESAVRWLEGGRSRSGRRAGDAV